MVSKNNAPRKTKKQQDMENENEIYLAWKNFFTITEIINLISKQKNQMTFTEDFQKIQLKKCFQLSEKAKMEPNLKSDNPSFNFNLNPISDEEILLSLEKESKILYLIYKKCPVILNSITNIFLYFQN